jgi:hypothetical protein
VLQVAQIFKCKFKIGYILDIFLKYWYDDILNDMFFKILKWWYVKSTQVNWSNLWYRLWEYDNFIKRKSN